MESVHKRGSTYHYSSTVGGVRVRASLGTSDKTCAYQLASRVSCALRDGEWGSLREALPPAAYRTLAKNARPDLTDFAQRFYRHLERREKLGEIASRSGVVYREEAERFFEWLALRSFRLLENITPSAIQEYRTVRQEQIQASPHFKNGRGLATCTAVLRVVFKFATEEGYLKTSPVRGGFARYEEPGGAEPFTPDEMAKLEGAIQGFDQRLLFEVFRWTGLRGSDVASLAWSDLDLDAGVLRKKTLKRGKTVTVPLTNELFNSLRLEYSVQHPLYPTDFVFPAATRAKLYSIIRKLGGRAGVKNCTPHRFRDTLACTILERGGTIYDVAKVLGDTVATVEKHYAPFTDKLQDRVRKILDSEAA